MQSLFLYCRTITSCLSMQNIYFELKYDPSVRVTHLCVRSKQRWKHLMVQFVFFFLKAEPSANLEANDGGILENDRFSMGRFIKKTCLMSVRLRVWFAVNQGHVLWLPCVAHNTLAPLQSAAVSWQEAACVCYELTSVNVSLPLRLPPLLRRACGPQSSFARFYACVWKGATEK